MKCKQGACEGTVGTDNVCNICHAAISVPIGSSTSATSAHGETNDAFSTAEAGSVPEVTKEPAPLGSRSKSTDLSVDAGAAATAVHVSEHTIAHHAQVIQYSLDLRETSINKIRALLKPSEVTPDRGLLAQAADELKSVFPYNYEAWRLHADLLINALHLLQTRHLQPDATFTLMAVPLRENDLRDAAENALRQCAHFADSNEKMIAAIDEANHIRRKTWF